MKKKNKNLPTSNSSLGGGILDNHKPRLEKFIKNKKQKQILIGTIIGLVVLIGGITLYRTFAMYKTEKSFDVIKGVVPDFRNYSKNDVNLIALKINGESTNVVPQKADYEEITVECDNEATGTWDKENWSLTVSNLKKIPTSCSVNFVLNIGFSWAFNYTGDEQSYVVPISGRYKIELWGAEGGKALCNGSVCNDGGNGAYTKGEINLKEGNTFYLYVGSAGTNAVRGKNVNGGYNGGGLGTWDLKDDEASAGGGGATDIRLVNGDWKNFDGLKSRIMVAAGGGGSSYTYAVGAGGGLTAPLVYSSITPASQTEGYAFGYGQDGNGTSDSSGVGGGGSGYYGGRTQNVNTQSSGNGGSSFISGHPGCNAIKQESTEGNIEHTGDSTHYSGFVFTNTEMKAGNEVMPMHDGTENTMTGNTGNGYARITYLGK